ncbi:MAG: hypothetical protein U9N86_14350 [Bacteroidota bacterium]|nr:hypothetical protein [Bacteroidota bacterium]
MRVKQLIIIGSILLLLFSCCKEEIAPVYDDPLIGSWNIVSVDSFASLRPMDSSYAVYQGVLDYSGFIQFNNDSTGAFVGTISAISGDQTHFLWKHDTTSLYAPYKITRLQFFDGYSSFYYDSIASDTVDFYFLDYISTGTRIGRPDWYHMKTIKIK